MKLLCDLHIHSALSPCADNDMTPGNIVGMARSVGLQVIAITDHQTCGNCAAAISLAEKMGGPLVIPGIEVESQEEIHMICLLPDLAAAEKLAATIWGTLPDIANRQDIFGDQLIFDESDAETGRQDRLLLQACQLSCDDLAALTISLGGACLPAHIDRQSNSMLTVLGRIPTDFPTRCLEISAKADEDALRAAHPELSGYTLIRGSDAHRLSELALAGSLIELPVLTLDSNGRRNVIKALRHGL